MAYGYGRGYEPQGGGAYNPYSKYPNFGGAARRFMQNMMMMKQMKQQKEQQMWQRGMQEDQLASLDAARRSADEARQQPKAPTIPSRVQEAIIASGQGGVPQNKINYGLVGKKLDEWRAKAEKAPGVDLEKKEYTKRKNTIKSLVSRLEKERTTLNQKSRPSQSELMSGEMPEKKTEFASQLKNIEGALDFVGKMGASLEGGTFGKRQGMALTRMVGNISGLREGTLLDEIRASWAEEAGIASTPATPAAPASLTRKQFKNKKTGKLEWFILKGDEWVKE